MCKLGGNECTRAHQKLTASTPLVSLPTGVAEYLATYPRHSIAQPLARPSGTLDSGHYATASLHPLCSKPVHSPGITSPLESMAQAKPDGQLWQMALTMLSLLVCTMSASHPPCWTLDTRPLRATTQRVCTKSASCHQRRTLDTCSPKSQCWTLDTCSPRMQKV